MIIEYESERLKFLLEDEKEQYKDLKRTVGNELCKAIVKRKKEFMAMSTFGMLLKIGLGKPHRLYGDLDRYYGVSITGNYRLLVKPKTDDLSPDSLKNCDTLILKGVDDYHGGKNNWIIY